MILKFVQVLKKKNTQLWENEFTICSSHSGIHFMMIWLNIIYITV